MKNPIQKLKAFTIGVNCPKDQQKRVSRNSNIFLVSLLLLITSLGFMIPSLIVGSESTLIFKNSDNVLGIRVGKILNNSELPQSPFYTYEKNGTVHSITHDNILLAYARTIGFMIIEKELIQILSENPQLYSQLIGIAMLKLSPMLKKGSMEQLNALPDLEIYPYLQQYPILLVLGNFQDDFTHDVIFKINTNKYFIPLFEVEYILLSTLKVYNVGGWNQFSDINTLKTQRGAWEISIDTITHNYVTSEYYAKDQLENIGITDLPAITIQGTIKQSNSVWYLFVPITKYSTSSSSNLF